MVSPERTRRKSLAFQAGAAQALDVPSKCAGSAWRFKQERPKRRALQAPGAPSAWRPKRVRPKRWASQADAPRASGQPCRPRSLSRSSRSAPVDKSSPCLGSTGSAESGSRGFPRVPRAPCPHGHMVRPPGPRDCVCHHQSSSPSLARKSTRRFDGFSASLSRCVLGGPGWAQMDFSMADAR